MKRVLSVFLVTALVLSHFTAVGLTAEAVSADVAVSAEVSGDYEYEVLDDGTAEITKYTGAGGDIDIPSAIDDYPVTVVDDSVFSGCKSLTGVTIPDSVLTIGEYAFSGCSKLTFVNFGKAVRTIGDNAFYRCSKLTNITIPDTVTVIGVSAFSKCSSLTGVTIGKAVTEISSSAFFECTGLTSVTIGKAVEEIGEEAFKDCGKLTEVTIPGSVTTIGEDAFGYYLNDDFQYVKVSGFTIKGTPGSAAKEYAKENGFTFIAVSEDSSDDPQTTSSGKSGDCTWTLSGSELVISGNGEMANYNVFGGQFGPWEGNDDIKKITICEGVTYIGDGAFGYCSGITGITIPDSVTKIGVCAFSGCHHLESVTIGIGVTRIESEAFVNCSALNEIDIPDNVISIDGDAFKGTAWYNDQPNGVVYAGKVAYGYKGECPSAIVIKGGTLGIAGAAFSNHTNLESVTLPDSLWLIGDVAFYDTNLKSITIPKNVASIGDRAFGIKYEWGYGYKPIDGFIVYGYSGTAAETYAKDNGFTFKSLGQQFAAPKLTKVENTANGVSLTVGKVTGAAKYRIFRKSGSGSFAKLADTTSLTYVDKTAKSGTTYAYTVCCISKDGKTETSKYDKTGKSILYIAQPAITKLANASTGVSITIGKVTGAAKYRIFRKTGSGSFAKLIDTTAVSIVDKTAKSGTKYTYTVRCISKDGKKYTSNYDKTGKSILYLAQPKITKRENVAKGIKLTLSKTTGAASYKIYLKSGKSWKGLATVKTNTYTYTKAKSGTTYTFTVRAVSKDGKTLSAYNTTGWKQKFVAAPALPTLKNTKSGVQVTIKKVAGAEKYRIFRKVGSGKWAKLIDTTKLTVLDKTAKNGKTYSYTIRCISKDGKSYTSAYNTKGKSVKYKK